MNTARPGIECEFFQANKKPVIRAFTLVLRLYFPLYHECVVVIQELCESIQKYQGLTLRRIEQQKQL
jgi:hypothetical protein